MVTAQRSSILRPASTALASPDLRTIRYSGHTGRWLASSSFGGQDRHPVDGSRDLTARLDPVEVIEAEVIDLDPDIIRMERSALKRQLNWKCGTAVVPAVVDAEQKSG
jgi:hypothetical protein